MSTIGKHKPSQRCRRVPQRDGVKGESLNARHSQSACWDMSALSNPKVSQPLTLTDSNDQRGNSSVMKKLFLTLLLMVSVPLAAAADNSLVKFNGAISVDTVKGIDANGVGLSNVV